MKARETQTEATAAGVEAAAQEIAKRWLADDLPLEAEIHSLKRNQLQALAKHVLQKHCTTTPAVSEEVQRLQRDRDFLQEAANGLRAELSEARAKAIGECVDAIVAARNSQERPTDQLIGFDYAVEVLQSLTQQQAGGEERKGGDDGPTRNEAS